MALGSVIYIIVLTFIRGHSKILVLIFLLILNVVVWQMIWQCISLQNPSCKNNLNTWKFHVYLHWLHSQTNKSFLKAIILIHHQIIRSHFILNTHTLKYTGTHARIHTHKHTGTYAHINTHKHTGMQAHTKTRSQTYTHTHINKHTGTPQT